MVDTTTRPALYVGTYNKYNSGSIDGAWLQLDDYDDPDEFWQACRELHKSEHDPEFMFQDYEGFPRELYSESASTDVIDKLFEYIKLDDYERELVREYVDATGSGFHDDISSLLSEAQDHFVCHLESDNYELEMGYYVVEEGMFGVKIPEELERYIDHEAIGRAWLDEMWKSSNGWVFTW